MIQLNDPYTSYHHEDTADIAKYIANELELDSLMSGKIIAAALLHDIGKQGIPKVILSKPTKLLEAEFELVKEHVNIGVDILQKVNLDAEIVQMVSEHHEKLDGSGYPNKLSGDQISLGGQILAVADIISALTSKRTYRAPTPIKKVKEILHLESSNKLNAKAVEAGIKYLDQL